MMMTSVQKQSARIKKNQSNSSAPNLRTTCFQIYMRYVDCSTCMSLPKEQKIPIT